MLGTNRNLEVRTEFYYLGTSHFNFSFSSQIKFLRKSYGSRLNIFAPINDLSSLSKTHSEHRSLVPGKKNDIAIAGGQILGDEYSIHVVKVSSADLSMFQFADAPEEPQRNHPSRRVSHIFMISLIFLKPLCSSVPFSSLINGCGSRTTSTTVCAVQSISDRSLPPTFMLLVNPRSKPSTR